MLFEALDEETKTQYNTLNKEDKSFKEWDLPTRVLLSQLNTKRSFDTWESMLEDSIDVTMKRIEDNFMKIFLGYDLKMMLPSPNTEERIIQLFLANFRNVEVNSNWDDESVNLEEYLRRIVTKYYLFLITIHANTSEKVRPGIVKAFSDYIKEFEETKIDDLLYYVNKYMPMCMEDNGNIIFKK